VFLAFISLGPLALVSGFDVSTEFYSEISRDIPLFGLGSMFSDFTGSFAGSGAMATLYKGMPSLVYLFVFLVFWSVVFEYQNCKKFLTYLENSRIESAGSRISRFSASIFLFASLLVISLSGLVAAILAYSMAELVLLPSESAFLLSTGFYSNIPVQAENIIRGSLVVIEQSLNWLPFLPVRFYSSVYYLIFFTPLVLTSILWLAHISSLYRERRSYDDLNRLDEIDISVEVVKIESEAPVVAPVSTGLGSSAVLVSQAVVDKLNDDELEAILRHEEYHIMNRDLLSNLVASVLSVGFGGRNALLAFYGYPGIEVEADKYAVKKTDKSTVIQAVKKMYELRNSFELREDDPGRFERVWKPFYRFYFGDFLLSTSHKSYSERRKMIAGFEE